MGIVDNAGALVVEYKYDAWGKLLGATGTLADTLGKRSPFRYRGYVFDEETGLYYLKSRYYSPIKMRFINADEFINLKKGILLHNLYAYCVNAPIISNDKNGHLWRIVTILATAVVAIVKAARVLVPMIGAEVQLVVNRQKAKSALENIEQERKDYLMYSYGGAANAMFEGVFGKYEWFYNQVNHNAPMDYKRAARRPWWALGCDTFYFHGRMITFEEYGNINYGYVGKALGIPDWIIFAGGGFAAVTGGGDVSSRVDYFFDSEEDHDSVAWGIEIYNQAWNDE